MRLPENALSLETYWRLKPAIHPLPWLVAGACQWLAPAYGSPGVPALLLPLLSLPLPAGGQYTWQPWRGDSDAVLISGRSS
jgi:hypothetical protein